MIDVYFYIAVAFITAQVLYWVVCYRNYRFVASKSGKTRAPVGGTLLIVPCKGLDEGFEGNITSFFTQEHDDYRLWFVVGEESDPAYVAILEMTQRLAGRTAAREVKVLVAGQTQGCSQKLHNLLHAYRQMGDDVVVMAFADSDIRVRSDWLAHLVYPLRKPGRYGAASGYRLFIPAKTGLAASALSSMNASVAQLLGPSGFNHAWGGSMAIRRDIFRELGIEEIWSRSISDDLALSRAVKEAGLQVAFVPACLVPSYTSIRWRGLLEFGRRQFVITRVTTPSLWMVGLASSLYSVAGLWGGAVIAALVWAVGYESPVRYAVLPAVFFLGHFWKAWLRHRTRSLVLSDRGKGAVTAEWTDMLLSWLWSPLLLGIILSSAFGRTIAWRGIKYRLLGPANVVVLDRND